jgi:hypothetical protein
MSVSAPASLCCASAGIAATILLAGPAMAGLNTASWHKWGEKLPVPFLLHLDGSSGQWSAYLRGAGLEILRPIEGNENRTYRWLWDGDAGRGFVQIEIWNDGANISSSRKYGVSSLPLSKALAFEKDLQSTEFATLVEDDHSMGLDDCEDQVLEAVVDFRYHYVRRACGMPDNIYAILRKLEVMAGWPHGASNGVVHMTPICCTADKPASQSSSENRSGLQ